MDVRPGEKSGAGDANGRVATFKGKVAVESRWGRVAEQVDIREVKVDEVSVNRALIELAVGQKQMRDELGEFCGRLDSLERQFVTGVVEVRASLRDIADRISFTTSAMMEALKQS
ncbi:MAG: hypothetical protein ACOZQL_42215 [Myxococcota bacterium]